MKLKYTRLQTALEVVGILLILTSFLFLFLRWPSIPSKIPGHYNLFGEVDRWGDKGELLVLLIAGAALYALLTAVSRYPQLWNVPVRLNEKNKAGVYRRMKNMLLVLKIEMAAVFSFLTVNSSMAQPRPGWFLPVVLTALFGSVVYAMIDIARYTKNMKQ